MQPLLVTLPLHSKVALLPHLVVALVGALVIAADQILLLNVLFSYKVESCKTLPNAKFQVYLLTFSSLKVLNKEVFMGLGQHSDIKSAQSACLNDNIFTTVDIFFNTRIAKLGQNVKKKLAVLKCHTQQLLPQKFLITCNVKLLNYLLCQAWRLGSCQCKGPAACFLYTAPRTTTRPPKVQQYVELISSYTAPRTTTRPPKVQQYVELKGRKRPGLAAVSGCTCVL